MPWATQTDFALGEVDATYRGQAGSELYRRSAKKMLNWWPTAAGSAKRRGMIGRLTTLALQTGDPESMYITSYYSEGLNLILFFSYSAPDLTLKYVRPDTGATATITPLGGSVGLPTDSCQVGGSLLLATPGGLVTVYGATVPTSMTLAQLYRELPDVWTWDGTAVPSLVTDDTAEGWLDGKGYPSTSTRVWIENTNQYANVSVVDADVVTPSTTGDGIDVANSGGNFTVSAFYAAATGGSPTTGRPFRNSRIFAPVTPANFGQFTYINWFQGRLVFSGFTAAGTTNRIRFSVPNNPYVAIPGNARPDSPIEFDMVTQEGSDLRWTMADESGLYIAARNEVITLSSDQTLVPDPQPQFVRAAAVATSTARPVRQNERVFYIDENQTAVYAVAYNDLTKSTRTTDLSATARGMVEGATQIVLRPSITTDPIERVFVLTDRNTIAVWSATQSESGAWSEITVPSNVTLRKLVRVGADVYIVGENGSAGGDIGKWWLAVIGYNTSVKYPLLDLWQALSHASSASWTGANSVFYNQTVFCTQVNGSEYIPLGFVSVNGSGAFTTPVACTNVIIGFPIDSRLELHRPDMQLADGNIVGRHHSVPRTILSVADTQQIYYNQIGLISQLVQPGYGFNAFTGEVETTQLGWKREHEAVIEGVGACQAEVRFVNREVVI